MNGSKLHENRSGPSPAVGVTRHASAAIGDALALAELQWQLLVADCRDSKQRLMIGFAAAIFGVILLMAALPVALFAVAALLRNAGFTEPAAYGIAAGGAAVVAILAVLIGWIAAKSALNVFSRSRAELANNIDAVRTLLGGHDHARQN